MDKTLIREALEREIESHGDRLQHATSTEFREQLMARKAKCLAALSELSKASEGEGWVSVKDWLPEADAVVLVAVQYLEFSKSEEPGLINKETIDLGAFVAGSGGGRMEAFGGPHGETPDNITHWIPLPPPPNTNKTTTIP